MPVSQQPSDNLDEATQNETADKLEKVIAFLDTLYEQGEECVHPDTGIVVTDGEYDAMRRELAALRPDSTLFQTATASELNSTVQKVVHDPPMTSIEKASHEDVATQEEMLFKWLTQSAQEAPVPVLEGPQQTIPDKTYQEQPVIIPQDYFYHAYKLDGVAIAIYYEDGKLVRAGLRPRDGINGEDVTAQVKYVQGVPNRLKNKVTCSVRGELICTHSDFAAVQAHLSEIGEKLRSNPRNHTAGGIRQFKDPSKTKLMRLSFVAYSIVGLANPPYRTEIERAAWCQEELGIPYTATEFFDFAQLAKMEADIPHLNFEVDGVIIGVNNLEDQEQLGRHGDPITGNPKGKIAWKFREEEATPVIKEIEWQTGRTGKIVAVAIFDAVRLAGTNVSRATLHNAGFMERNQIALGSQIAVRKAGKIIPKVTRVIKGQAQPKFPKQCPACGAKTTIEQGGTEDMRELVCTNKTCSAQSIYSLCHYLSTFGVLGVGESRVASLVEGGVVDIPADFYRFDLDDAMASGLTKRQALLVLGGIHLIPTPEKLEDDELEKRIETARKTKKPIPLSRLLAAFGIQQTGKSTGKALADHFKSFEKIRAASVEDLEAVPDVGEKTAQWIHDYLQEHQVEIDDLLRYVEPELPKTGKLTGKTFCFSGGFEKGKKHWEQIVTDLGGKCSGTVSKKTDFLVAGGGSGSKSEKAKQLDIPIINVEQLQEMLDSL